MAGKTIKAEYRTMEQLREHYEIEKELASRLHNASRQERQYMYSSLYNELYQRVPHHPGLTRKVSPEQTRAAVSAQMPFFKHFLNKESTFLEIGAGDCALSLEVAKFVRQVYAVDVSNQIISDVIPPDNFKFILSDGCSIPVPECRVNVAYSNQLIEHLHPGDVIAHLQSIYNVLIPGCVYICVTPNKLNGPHDISMYFDPIATGFHLKEYTISELSSLFRDAGFSKFKALVGGNGIYINTAIFPLVFCEKLLCMLPRRLRKPIAVSQPFRSWLGIRLMAIK